MNSAKQSFDELFKVFSDMWLVDLDKHIDRNKNVDKKQVFSILSKTFVKSIKESAKEFERDIG